MYSAICVSLLVAKSVIEKRGLSQPNVMEFTEHGIHMLFNDECPIFSVIEAMEGMVYISQALLTCSVKIVLLFSIIVVLILMQALVSSKSDQIVNTSELIQCQSGDGDIHYSYKVTSQRRLLSHTVMVRDETPELN